MRNQEEIIKEENEQAALECQYAARYYFNTAEKYFTGVLLFSIISLVTAFVPSANNATLNSTLQILSIISDVVVMLLTLVMHKAVNKAATLRNHFDRVVFDLRDNNSSEDMHRIMCEWIYTATHKKPEFSELQMQNTGSATPPGVRDWYEFSKTFPDSEAVHECQRQNVWWDKKQSKGRLMVLIILMIIAIALLIIYAYNGASIIKFLVCVISILVSFFDPIKNCCDYIAQSYILDGASIITDYDGNQQQITRVQELIENRREIPVLGINRIHARSSKQLSEQYEKISKG